MKKYHVRLDQVTVERLRGLARRRAFLQGREVNWMMLLRDAADQLLAAEDQNHHAATIENTTILAGGAR
jgi:hypothetical protein